MAYQNGRIPSTALRRSVVGVSLRADAAESADRLATAFHEATGTRLVATDGYRPLTGDQWSQEEIFLARYEPRATGRGPFGDVRWWRGVRYVRVRGAAAAIPGTSNHGLGLALDLGSGVNTSFTSPAHKALAKIAPAHGWSNDEGRAVGEPWHWVYDPARDTRPGALVALPTTFQEDAVRRTTHDRKKKHALPKKWVTLPVNDKGHTSVATHVGAFDSLVQLALTGVRPGATVQVRFYIAETDAKGKNPKTVVTYPITEVHGTAGGTFAQVAQKGLLHAVNGPRERRLRVQILAPHDGIHVTRMQSRTDTFPA